MAAARDGIDQCRRRRSRVTSTSSCLRCNGEPSRHRRSVPAVRVGPAVHRAAGEGCGRDGGVQRGRVGADRDARAVAAAAGRDPTQPRLRRARGDRLRPAPFFRPAVLAERLRLLCRLPSAGPRVHRRPAACARPRAGGAQRHRAAESSPPALVRMGWRERQPVDGEPAADPRPARDRQQRREGGLRGPHRRRRRMPLSCGVRRGSRTRKRPRRCSSTWARRSPRTRKRSSPAARRSTIFATRWRAARPRPRRTRPPRGEVSRSSSAAAIAIACHSGPNFTDRAFRATGVPQFMGSTVPDTGRYAGVTDTSREPLQSARPVQRRRRVTPPTRHEGRPARPRQVAHAEPAQCRRDGTVSAQRHRGVAVRRGAPLREVGRRRAALRRRRAQGTPRPSCPPGTSTIWWLFSRR